MRKTSSVAEILKSGAVAGVVAGLFVLMREFGQVLGRDFAREPLLSIRHAALLALVLLIGGVVLGLLARLVLSLVWKLGVRSWLEAEAVPRPARLGISAAVAVLLLAGGWTELPSAAVWWDVAAIALLVLAAYPGLARAESVAPDRLLPGVVGGLAATLAFFASVGLLLNDWALPGAAVALLGSGAIAAAAGYAVFGLLALAGLRSDRLRGGKAFGIASAALVVLLIGLVWWQRIDERAYLPRLIARSGVTQGGQAGSDAPSVILISVDTLRHDYVGYAGGPARTPTIDALAEESFVFTRAYSVAPWTRPSFASFLSGLYPSEMGVARIPGYERSDDMIVPFYWATKPELLPEVFQAGGWATAATVCNVNLTAAAHADQGFDLFYNTKERRIDRASRLANKLTGGRLIPEDLERADIVTAAALQVLGEARGPLLFWAHYLDPHNSYAPPTLEKSEQSAPDKVAGAASMEMRTAQERQKTLRAYAAETEWTDDNLAPVLEELRSSGLWDSSIVVFWSDHGEEFWEHSSWQHGQSFFEDQVHVPLLIHMPGQTERVTVDEPVSLLDVMPTLTDLCGLQGPQVRGVSLAPLLRGEVDRVEPHSFFMEALYRGGISKALLAGDYKLIYDVYFDRFTLFDVTRDPAELTNLVGTAEAPPALAGWETDLRAWTDESLALMSALVSQEAIEVSPEIREQLRDMGYIQ